MQCAAIIQIFYGKIVNYSKQHNAEEQIQESCHTKAQKVTFVNCLK